MNDVGRLLVLAMVAGAGCSVSNDGAPKELSPIVWWPGMLVRSSMPAHTDWSVTVMTVEASSVESSIAGTGRVRAWKGDSGLRCASITSPSKGGRCVARRIQAGHAVVSWSSFG